MKLTTGYDFQGYYITDYYDVIFDEMLVGIGFFRGFKASIDNALSSLTGTEATAMIEKLNNVKAELRARIIQKAEKLGANALIGIDFESSRLGDLLMVSMTATAVRIEQIVGDRPYTVSDKARDDAEKAEKQREEEMKARLDKARQSNSFSSESFLHDLSLMENTVEMMDYVKSAAARFPELFPDSLIKSLENSVFLGRLYGSAAGRADFLTAVKNNFSI